MARKVFTDAMALARDMEGELEGMEKAIYQGMVQTATELHAKTVKRAPRGARSRGRSGGARLAGSFVHGVIRRSSRFIGFCGTNVGYAKYPEFGTRNIRVGTPQGPRTDWAAKRARAAVGMTGRGGQSMPYLRAAWADVLPRHVERMRRAGRG